MPSSSLGVEDYSLMLMVTCGDKHASEVNYYATIFHHLRLLIISCEEFSAGFLHNLHFLYSISYHCHSQLLQAQYAKDYRFPIVHYGMGQDMDEKCMITYPQMDSAKRWYRIQRLVNEWYIHHLKSRTNMSKRIFWVKCCLMRRSGAFTCTSDSNTSLSMNPKIYSTAWS